MKEEIVKEASRIVGWNNVLLAPEELVPFKYDASEFKGELPSIVVMPENEEQVSELMALSYDKEIPVVLRGGGSSLTGASIPAFPNTMVISFSNMVKIHEVNIIDSYVFVEAGVRLDDLNAYLSQYGYMFPPDPASSAVATVGGCIAGNSGGMRGAKFGQVKNWVLGLNAVLPGGDIIRVGGKTLKIRQGLDLVSLIVGSEGILAAVTSAYLKIWPAPEKIARILAYYDDLSYLMQAVTKLRESKLAPLVMEFLGEGLLDAVRRVYGDVIEAKGRNLLLIDIDGPEEALRRYVDKAIEALENEGLILYKIPKTPEEMERAYLARRAAFPSSLKMRKKPSERVLVSDIVVPPSKLISTIREIETAIDRSGLRAPIGGHVGDGNIHSDIFYDEEDEDEKRRAWKLLEEMAEIAIKYGGSVSAEHGIGLEKRELLKKEMKSKGSLKALEIMREIKKIFDPKNLLNPGKVI